MNSSTGSADSGRNSATTRPSAHRLARFALAVAVLVVPAGLAPSSSAAGLQFTSISAGSDFACAVVSGRAMCWGSNAVGELGTGTRTSSWTPVPVSGLGSGVTAVTAGGGHACALISGGVTCWGSNALGQLGTGSASAWSTTPVPVAGLSSGVTAISAGQNHTCALTSGGGVKCWGSNEGGVRLSGVLASYSATPVDIPGLTSGVVGVSVGVSHTCVVTSGGAVKCWGVSSSGELGDGLNQSSATPVEVTGLSNGAVAVAAGGSFSCAVTAAGAVRCWGADGFGQLGDGGVITNAPHPTPVDVTGLGSGVASVTTGTYHACARTVGGAVLCWGNNTSGQLGMGSTSPGASAVPVGVVGLTGGVSVVSAAESNFTCAVTDVGGAKCWGASTDGELGDGRNTSSSTPVDVVLPPGDTTAPTVTVLRPVDQAAYVKGQAVTAAYSCADESGGSGLASCVGTVPSGAPFDTTTIGVRTFTVTAVDNAGNATTRTVGYTVFAGLAGPLDAPPTVNRANAGSRVPLVFSLGGDRGLSIFPAGSPASRPVSCASWAGSPTDPVETTVSSPGGLTYDAATGQYTYVWVTQKVWAGTCRQLVLSFAPAVPDYGGGQIVFDLLFP